MTATAIFELTAELRHDQGKGASRRLRRLQDRIPAILYGGPEAPVAITLDHKKFMHALEHKAFYSHILTLDIAGKKQPAVLKALQRHHYKKSIFHADFLRISATDKINMRVPLQFIGDANCPGVKAGGIVSHRAIDVEVRCLARDLPEYITLDLSSMELDQTLHLSDLKLPKGVEILQLSHGDGTEHDHAVVSIHMPRRAELEETPATVAEVKVAPKGKEAKPASATANKEKGKGK